MQMLSINARKAYIRYREDLPDSVNNFAALDGFRQLGVEVAPIYGFGDIEKLSDLGPEVLVTGFIGDVWTALASLGLPRPVAIDYPNELKENLRREIYRCVLGDIRGTTRQIFIKPVEQKVFQGFVWDGSLNSRKNVVTCADDVEIWASEPIIFVSEYRCFILNGTILDVRRYKGDWSKTISRKIVEDAVLAYKSAPKAFVLDFGVTSTGDTILVEANDAYAFGNYGLHSVLYAQMIDARWKELTWSYGS